MSGTSTQPEDVAIVCRDPTRARAAINDALRQLRRKFPAIQVVEERDDGLTVAVQHGSRGLWLSKHCPPRFNINGLHRPAETCIEPVRRLIARLA